MSALALVAALALADPLPPQNQPVNITQVSGTPVGSSVPVTCVSGCGGGSSGGGGGAAWDGGVIVQYPVAIASLWDGGVVVQNFPAVQAVSQSGPWVIDVDPDGGPLQVACVSGCGGGSGGGGASWDAGVIVQNDVTVLQGTDPWDVTGTVAVMQDTIPWSISGDVTQSGNWSVLMEYDGGPIPITGFLAYTYGSPLPADTSYQTSCSTSITFCGTTSVALTACAGGKWQDFQNQSTQSIYICAQAGCSAPTAIDAGTVVGEQVQPFATYFANGSAQYWCVVPTSPQVSPDAGTVTKCCK